MNMAGKVTQCRVVIGGGKVLSDNTCARAMQLQFKPGTDQDGKPAPSIYVLRVQWKMGR